MTNLEKYGFTFKRKIELKEIDATLYEMEHIKTGAGLIYLDREDENKTFSIGFPTPPTDDTGVFHIIEHSVLCGSRKYPLRDPFAELLKGSLNTFLNAMTYEDRTVYPVSSRCEKDFLNLVDVYMDAVLRPNMLDNPSIFRQEGWHYEYNEEKGALSINGVVYNEMKGAYSSPDELSGMALCRALYDGSIYACDSGGNPSAIPSLTFEDFKATHKKYYHPSSAKIVLDGRMDLSKILSLIDSHLSEFERCEATVLTDSYEPKVVPPVTVSYEIAENESENGKARIIYGFVFSDYSDKEAQLTATILSDILCGSNASPLKKTLLDKGLCKDVAMYQIKSRRQTVVLEIRDTDAEKAEEIDRTIRDVIGSLCNGGIDKERLIACLNNIEFRLRERDFGTLPTGIAFAMSLYGDWMWGGQPEDALLIEDLLKSLREKVESDCFEKTLASMTLENDHVAKVIMLPDKALGQKNREKEERELAELLGSMSREKIEEIKSEEAALRLWQQTEETEEAMASLPTLSLSDIRSKPEKTEPTEHSYNGAKILDCKVKTKGIVYISLHFNACDLANEELVSLSMLSSVLMNSPTKTRDALSLQNDVKANLGSLFASFAIGERNGITTPYLKVGASALSSKTDDLVRLISELLLESVIESERDVKTFLMQIKASLEDGMISSGETFALSRVEASVSEGGAIAEYLSGYEAYKTICHILSDDERIKELTKSTSRLLKKLAVRERLIVSVSGDADPTLAEILVDIFPSTEDMPIKETTSPCAEKEEFILLPSRVAYAVVGGKSNAVKEKLGLMRVVRSILSYEYLWNTVRVQSGAYGTGFVARRDGSLSFYSYRDPSPARSLGFYKESSNYLRALADSGEDITKFIIGAIGEYDIIITPRTASALAVRDYLNGRPSDEESRVIKEMLSVTPKDLLLAADIIDEVLSDMSLAIVGGSEHLESLEKKPGRIITI